MATRGRKKSKSANISKSYTSCFKIVDDDSSFEMVDVSKDEPFKNYENEKVFTTDNNLNLISEEGGPLIIGDDSDLHPMKMPPFRVMWDAVKSSNCTYNLTKNDIQFAKRVSCSPYLVYLIIDVLEASFGGCNEKGEMFLEIPSEPDKINKMIDDIFDLIKNDELPLRSPVLMVDCDHVPVDLKALFSFNKDNRDLIKDIIRYWIHRRTDYPEVPWLKNPTKSKKTINDKVVASYPLNVKNMIYPGDNPSRDDYITFQFDTKNEYPETTTTKKLKKHGKEILSDLKYIIESCDRLLTRELMLYQKILREQEGLVVEDVLKYVPLSSEHVTQPSTKDDDESESDLIQFAQTDSVVDFDHLGLPVVIH